MSTKVIANVACYNVTWSITNDIWVGDDIMLRRVPLLGLQIAYNNLVSRLCYHILSPLRVPVIVSQIFVSILNIYYIISLLNYYI